MRALPAWLQSGVAFILEQLSLVLYLLPLPVVAVYFGLFLALRFRSNRCKWYAYTLNDKEKSFPGTPRHKAQVFLKTRISHLVSKQLQTM